MTLDQNAQCDGNSRIRRTALIVFASAAVVTLVVAAIAVLGRPDRIDAPAVEPGSTSPPATAVATTLPAATGSDTEPDIASPNAVTENVLRAYESAINTGDLEAMMALYDSDATVGSHPMAGDLRGTTEIERAERALLNQLRSTEDEVFFVTDIRFDDGAAAFGHVALLSNCNAGTGHRVIVENGLITSVDWGTVGEPCVLEIVRQVRDLIVDDTVAAAQRFAVGAEVTAHPFDSIADPASGREEVAGLLARLADLAGPDVEIEVRDERWRGASVSFDLVIGDGVNCRVFDDVEVIAEGGLITSWQFGADRGTVACT